MTLEEIAKQYITDMLIEIGKDIDPRYGKAMSDLDDSVIEAIQSCSETKAAIRNWHNSTPTELSWHGHWIESARLLDVAIDLFKQAEIALLEVEDYQRHRFGGKK